MNYIDINNGIATGLVIATGITKDETLLILASIFILLNVLLKISERKR